MLVQSNSLSGKCWKENIDFNSTCNREFWLQIHAVGQIETLKFDLAVSMDVPVFLIKRAFEDYLISLVRSFQRKCIKRVVKFKLN